MLKRITMIVVLIFITSLFSVSVFADGGDKGDKTDKKETTQKAAEKATPIITITRPEDDTQKTFNNKYTICGITTRNNISIKLFKKNSDNSFSEFKDNYGYSEWEVGDSGFFSIDITLSRGYKSASTLNSFIVKAFDRTNPDDCAQYPISITLLDATKLKSEVPDYSLEKILKPTK